MEKPTLYFETDGPGNTEATLAAGATRAGELGVNQVVVATTTGKTALAAAEALGEGCAVVGVTLQRGLWGKYAGPDEAIVAEAEGRGVRFLTCPHSLMGAVDSALRDKFGGLPPQHLIAHVYYTFGQGMKVAVECMLMAADAGMLAMDQEVITIAGTEYGADTAIVVSPVFTSTFFDLKVREIIAMPR